MRKLLIITAVLFGLIGAKAQNPFVEYGYTPKIATLSQGQFNEFFDNDTIVHIGSVLYNTKSREIVAFVDSENLCQDETIQPDVVSRWISPDPLADHPTQIGLTPYHYAGNNPIYWTDPDGRCPWCLVWAAVEVGLAIYDAYETGTTIIDPKASTGEKWAAAGGFVLGTIMPGGGYGTGAKQTAKAVDKAMDAGKVADKANNAQKAANKAPNPYGSKGKPDHQEKVKELTKKAEAENPFKDIVTEKKIQTEGSTRKPDVQVVDPKTGKTEKVYEAERRPNSTRNQKREEEYKRLGIPNETHKVGGN
jgi:hypothetical protein